MGGRNSPDLRGAAAIIGVSGSYGGLDLPESGYHRGIVKTIVVTICLVLAAVLPGRAAVKVAVLPLDVLGEAGHEWVGRAMQEALGTGVQGVRGISATLVPAVSPTDANFALNAGRSAGADFVIFGSIQFVDDQMRVSGRVVAVASGQIVGTLSADSNLRDLFTVEDALAQRAARLISPPPASTASAGAAPRPEIQLVGPTLPLQETRYFDGNLSSITSTPDRFRNEYDRYYYHPTGSSLGTGWGGFGGCGSGGFGLGGYGIGPVGLQTSVGAIGTW
jgi:TolB-like protein